MAQRSDAPDPAVDELRRKARRRLVGAVVLALAVAVALPLLLENEPKPLGDDVSIQIPPVDSGKFVNPLSPGGPPASKADEKPVVAPERIPQPAANDVATKSDKPKNDSPGAEPAKIEPAKTEPQPPARDTAPSPPPKTSEAPAPPAQSSAAPPVSENKAEARGSGSEAKSPATKQPQSGFVVQVAAFSDRYGARSLVAKLKKGGFPSYTETVETDKGTLHRVRVGPYSSREVADAARAKLKAAGYSGVVARSG